MFQSRKFYLSLLTAVALLSATSSTIFCLVDAAALSSRAIVFRGLPIAASTFNVISIFCVAAFSQFYVWRTDGVQHPSSGRTIRVTACIFLSTVALALSLATVITIKRRLSEVTAAATAGMIGDWNGYIVGHLTIWACACLTQVALYSIPHWNGSPKKRLISIPYNPPRDSVMSEARTSHQTTDLYLMGPTQPSSPLAMLASPTFSNRSSQSLRSWQESLHQVVRPVTSRSRLITRPSFSRDSQSMHSERNSIETASQTDGFESWDTSSVSMPAKDALLAPSRGTVLETIPGSRPASPARALGGPSPLSAEADEANPLSPPPKLLPDHSRPPSPVVSEAHIHPLFRTESPVPPPEVLTPTTNVLASPLSTQMIACPPRPYSRMRSGSRTASPSLLQRSSRSPSPPSRRITPPIPDFVLTSSPRSRTTGSKSRKKVNPQLTASP